MIHACELISICDMTNPIITSVENEVVDVIAMSNATIKSLNKFVDVESRG